MKQIWEKYGNILIIEKGGDSYLIWIRKLILNTPLQIGVFKSYAVCLTLIYLILGPLRDLVKISVVGDFSWQN